MERKERLLGNSLMRLYRMEEGLNIHGTAAIPCRGWHSALRALRRYVPQNPLEQSRQKADCLEMCYKAECSGSRMSGENAVRGAVTEFGAGSNQ